MGISISIATGLYGISFGALAVAAGLSVAQAMVLSLLMFTGGSQFAFIGVLATGGGPPAAFGAATLLYVRNAIYGAQMNLLVRPGRLKWLAAHVTIDESAGTASVQESLAERKVGFWVAGVGVFALWNVMTFVGALAGESMGDPAVWGLDGAAVAAFIALLWPRISKGNMAGIAVACAFVTFLAIPVVPSGVPIVISAVVAGTWGWVRAQQVHRKSSSAQSTTSGQEGTL
ncbi:AzlC family ABC transporter permease [Jonesiaceae bacterium BS-20]|uniref:AzlC family ABC transporter permease n=1 Tax=Jonesiaceae bacterium BS-20 TaxID=3120821 RepID=A0AAU7E147_9MICO